MIAILNTLSPSVAIAAIAFLVLRYLRRLDSATRFAIWWLVLLAIVVLPLIPRPAFHHAKTVPAILAPPLAHYRQLPAIAPAVFDAPIVVEPSAASSWPKFLFAAWAIISAVKSLQLVRAYLYLRRLKRGATPWDRPLPVSPRGVRLLLSNAISSPVAIGFLRPSILIPAALPAQISDDGMDHVLLHEAAHVARRDDWTTLLARILGAIFVLQPVVLWVLSRIDREREMACDDWVVAHTGAARLYAESLVQVCELSRGPARAVLAPGVLGRKSHVRERIEHLVTARAFGSRASAPRLLAGAGVLAGLTVGLAVAPRWIAFAQRPEFEVASVKLNKIVSPRFDTRPQRSGDLVTMHRTRLFTMIFYAYHLTGNFQLVGNQEAQPWWDWYDLDAKAPETTSEDQLRLMLQALLEDRFKLKVHRETRELPAYRLVLAKAGLKLKPEAAAFDFKVEGRSVPLREGSCLPLLSRDGVHLGCKGGTIAQLASILRADLRSPVVDETGLTGQYDFELVYQPPNASTQTLPDDLIPAPPIPEAIQSLGLRLEKGKAPVEVLVVDHVEKPGEN